MAKKNLLPDVDVICTSYVLNVKGYKEQTGERLTRQTAHMWAIMSKKTYPTREFRLATPAEVEAFRSGVPITKSVESAEVKKLKAYIAELEANQNIDPPVIDTMFVPKTKKEIQGMKKEELIKYCSQKHNTDPALYEGMLNRELVAEAIK